MNLIIISLFIIGVLAIAYDVVYTLANVHTGPLWARILSIIVLLGGYVGIIAFIMFIFKIPLS